ncbi:phospholipase D-like domain-containing protein [Halomonas piscis]|uniref:phospholipase D n=1 Tax=Halomonas piscis TaxID=3031727 RepID=A0ABY9YZ89_9GAMM|nr:phospholipase D-like domain-containing protein [Halomonas piscis]WNK19790.1 phospholipase D-like domain-containing protein [Halomonas piscis]
MLWALLLLAAAWLAMGLWQRYKPLPDGVGVAWPARPADNVRLLTDETWYDAEGHQHRRQAIFDEVMDMIAQARRLVVADMFLFNDFAAGADSDDVRPLSGELADALIEQKRRHPGMSVKVITDPLNTLYGAQLPEHLARLEDAGVELIMTDLSRLRASNPLWSGLWHLGLHRLGNDRGGGWLPNPLGEGRITLRSYLAMANFRANHRKTLVVDQGDGWAGLVTSANPHDASSRHDNVALRFEGPAALDLLASERLLAGWSGSGKAPDARAWPAASAKTARQRAETAPEGTEGARLRLLTEAAIRDAALGRIRQAGSGDRLDIAMFYLAHRATVEALKAASARGVVVRVLLDPNREAFGIKKSGIPNRPVAAELAGAGAEVRWCITRGEQCHTKLLLHRQAADASPVKATMILGSANLTRRNLDNLNLETSVSLAGNDATPAIARAAELFERQWLSPASRRTSVALAEDAAVSPWKRWRYRLMEATGLSSF